MSEPKLFTYWWLHILLELGGIAVAVGVVWGIIKTKIDNIEGDIGTLKTFHQQQEEFMGSVMTKEDCLREQETCQAHMVERLDHFGEKIDNVGSKVETSINNNTGKWHQVATILGAICQKLEINLPNWK